MSDKISNNIQAMNKHKEQPMVKMNEDMDDFDMDEMQVIPMGTAAMPMYPMNCPYQMMMPYMNENLQQMPMSNTSPIYQTPNINIPYAPMDEMDMNETSTNDMDMEDDLEMGITDAMRGFYEDIDQYIDNYSDRIHGDVDDILRKIEQYNPGIFRRLVSFGIPFPVARNIVRRIIRLTLNYYR